MVFNFIFRPWQIAVGVVAVLFLLAGIYLGPRPFDDSFISYRYAANVAHGDGLVYNRGEHVLGTTTPLWAFVLATVSKTGLSLPVSAFFTSLLLVPIIGLLMFALLRQLEYNEGIAASTVILFFGLFDFLSIARSGMETSLFISLLFLTLYTGLRKSWVLAGVCAFLLCITRPEGLLVLIVLTVQFALRRKENTAANNLLALAGALTFIVLAVAWLIWTEGYYGSIIPQTIRAKTYLASHDLSLHRLSWTNVRLFLTKGQYGGYIFERTYLSMNCLLTLLAILGGYSLFCHNNSNFKKQALALITLMFFPIAFAGGLSVTHAFTFFPWYYGPLYPFLAILAVIGSNWLWSQFVKSGTCHGQLAAVVILVCAQLLAAILVKIPADRQYFWVQGLALSVKIVPQNPSLTLATPEIGVIGWDQYPARILDLAGLVTPEALMQSNVDYLRSKRPDYLLLRTDNAAGLLAELNKDSWFSTNYELISSIRDPYTPREFQTFHRL